MSDRDVTVAPDDYTAKLMAELVQVMEERDTLRFKFEVSQGMRRDEHERHAEESAKLRERITTQKQTIQAYRDESREWREAAERAQAENDKLRELCRLFAEYADQDRCEGCCVKTPCRNGEVEECPLFTKIRELARELGIEVPE